MDTFSQLVAGLDPLGGPVPGPNARGRRPSAILALLTRDPDPELLFTERAGTLRAHAGQISFPGGRIDPGDASVEDAALREAAEEVGLDPRGVELLGRLPSTPHMRMFHAAVVVAAWDGNQELLPEPGEVASILRYPLSLLASAQTRATAPHSRGEGPAFVLGEMVIWGFTAHLTDRLLHLGGWETPWDAGRMIEVPRRFRRD